MGSEKFGIESKVGTGGAGLVDFCGEDIDSGVEGVNAQFLDEPTGFFLVSYGVGCQGCGSDEA